MTAQQPQLGRSPTADNPGTGTFSVRRWGGRRHLIGPGGGPVEGIMGNTFASLDERQAANYVAELNGFLPSTSSSARDAMPQTEPIGCYWNKSQGRGCCIGCTIEDAIRTGTLPKTVSHKSHESIAKATGLPEMAWRLADNIFEGLPAKDRPAWTPRFLRSAQGCRKPETVGPRIMSRLARRLAEDAIRPECKTVALVIAGLWDRRANGDDPPETEWDAAREQAYAAWKQAGAAREQAYAAWKQAGAARKQAYAAWKQAGAAREQAGAAREQAYAAWEQADAAREQWWSWCADLVCEILTES